MRKSKHQIINEIMAHMQKGGGSFRAWYVGVGKDARNRLFNGHRVKENGDWWIYREATSSLVARDVEGYFVNTLGTDGGLGGGDFNTDMVYAYKKAVHTNP